jgi:hypothetical protein
MKPIHHDTIELVRSHYLEMPGLRLQAEQVRRLCGIAPTICQLVLDGLVDEQFLCVRRDGTYTRVTEGPLFRPQPPKADSRTRTLKNP